MSMKYAILGASLIACLGTTVPVFADDIIISTAPPALREETVPAPRSGYVWARGYWAWENGQYVWRSGRWIETRPRAHWVSDSWVRVNDEQRWRYVPGHWEED